jgi:hypothetical protein
MKLSEVSLDDGRQCAAIINALNIAKFDGLTGKDIETLVAAKKWLQSVAMQMAGQLKAQQAPASAPAPAPSEGFKIKSMGQLPSASKTSKRKK